MKNIRVAIVFCIAIIWSISLYSQDTFKPIRIEERCKVMFSIVSQDGGYLVCHTKTNSKIPEVTGYVVSKFDVNGNVLWYKEFNDIVLLDVAELKDGSLIFIGIPPTNGENDGDYIIAVKLNPCGRLEWSKSLTAKELGCNYIISSAITDMGDGCIIPIRLVRHNDDIATIVKIDYNGDILWEKALSFDEKRCTDRQLMKSKLDNNGNIVVLGGVCVPYYENSDLLTLGAMVVKLDREGNLLWEVYSYYDFWVFNTAWDSPLVDNENNTFITIEQGWTELIGASCLSNNSVIKIDDRGNAVANEIYIPETDPSSRWSQNGNGFAWIDNKEHIVTSVRFMPSDYDGGEGDKKSVAGLNDKAERRIVRSDNRAFENVNMLKLGYDNMEHFEHFVNRLFIVDKYADIVKQLDVEDYKVGEITDHMMSVENNNVLVFSYNSCFYEGHECVDAHIRKYTNDLQPAAIDNTVRNYDPFCNSEIESEVVDLSCTEEFTHATGVKDVADQEKIMRVYPNPANGNVKLYLLSGLGEKVIDFYDTTGRLCKSTTIGEGWAQANIDISDLSDGIYVLKLTVDNKVVGNEKLIVR